MSSSILHLFENPSERPVVAPYGVFVKQPPIFAQTSLVVFMPKLAQSSFLRNHVFGVSNSEIFPGPHKPLVEFLMAFTAVQAQTIIVKIAVELVTARRHNRPCV